MEPEVDAFVASTSLTVETLGDGIRCYTVRPVASQPRMRAPLALSALAGGATAGGWLPALLGCAAVLVSLLATVRASFLGARAWNGEGLVVDTPAPGDAPWSAENGGGWPVSYATAGDWAYCDLLAASLFTLVPNGDAYWDSRLPEAVNAGSIPVVFAGDTYKGCDAPARHMLQETGAPFLYVDDWDEFPAKLAAALALGEDALQAWQDNVTAWCALGAPRARRDALRRRAGQR